MSPRGQVAVIAAASVLIIVVAVVLIRWGPGGGPRNVLIRRENGELAVRPFRGLRKPKGGGTDDAQR